MSATDQRWEAGGYKHHAGFVPELGMPVVELLDPRPGERILDLGCGEGTLTERLAALGCDVVGVDSSPEFIETAKARGLDARVVDAHALPFAAEFDAVFSNAALHWMTGPDAVVAGVARALRPGGRFVGEFGGAGNVGRIVAALEAALVRRGLDGRAANPWYFPTPEEYREKLEAAGFRVRSIALIPRPTPLPTDMAGWLATFAQSFLNRVSEAERPSLVAEVLETVAPELRDAEGRWTADYVRLRFSADKPA
ncbi:class I SAM-dependent methyltransferase [Azospirillum doebereinerae]|uniref:class I SAM-dependent methyltransferase n=1 Tax=Azospirillum doebereinerae TaxID=92933 RepID=UPI001EE63421|nr:class I SAM-dependent methyltransferase [Azospirillum doebereinerae]MCG5239576.1 class I SAM-dependent methyltransferase [Azospirillum doebereinerae]